MHRHLVLVTAPPALQRPAKVVVLEARRQARLQRVPPQRRPPRPAA